MSCKLDHLSIVAPTLDEGVEHVRECLDIDIPFGRKHFEMGTHNHLLSLGEAAYLEVIAVDPQGITPTFPRWFGLDNAAAIREAWDKGKRLKGWVASTTDINRCLTKHASALGVSRRFVIGASEFLFAIPADGTSPMGGAAPFLIDRLGRAPSVPSHAQLNCTLSSFQIEHPHCQEVRELIDDLNVLNAPQVVFGESFGAVLSVLTPTGTRTIC